MTTAHRTFRAIMKLAPLLIATAIVWLLATAEPQSLMMGGV